MNKRIGIAASVLVGMLLVVLACKKIEQPDLSTVKDPCDCAKEVSADFDILEENLPIQNSILTVTDHVLHAKNVFFRAKEEDAEYKWYIGSEIETEQETYKHFGSQWIGSDIPITLVVKKNPNKVCFPDDDGYDSIKKVFHVYDRCMNPHLLDGSFRVAPINSVDSFDIHIEFKYIPSQNECYSMDFTNFDNQGSFCTAEELKLLGRSYRFVASSSTTSFNSGCKNLLGVKMYFRLDNILELSYFYREIDGGPQIFRDVRGRKL
jgi:hypothetical protein